MTPAQALLLMQCRADVPDQQCYEAMVVLAEAVVRARVVGVLDGFAGKNEGSHSTSPNTPLGDATCTLLWRRPNKTRSRTFRAATEDAARVAAAKAIEAGELG